MIMTRQNGRHRLLRRFGVNVSSQRHVHAASRCLFVLPHEGKKNTKRCLLVLLCLFLFSFSCSSCPRVLPTSDNVVACLLSLSQLAGAHAANILQKDDPKAVLDEIAAQDILAHAPIPNKSDLPDEKNILTFVAVFETDGDVTLNDAVVKPLEFVAETSFARVFVNVLSAPLTFQQQDCQITMVHMENSLAKMAPACGTELKA